MMFIPVLSSKRKRSKRDSVLKFPFVFSSTSNRTPNLSDFAWCSGYRFGFLIFRLGFKFRSPTISSFGISVCNLLHLILNKWGENQLGECAHVLAASVQFGWSVCRWNITETFEHTSTTFVPLVVSKLKDDRRTGRMVV